MKNKEKYLDEILEVVIKHNGGRICDWKIDHVLNAYGCGGYTCEECQELMRKWLEQEYKESIKLTEDEKVILRNIDKNYKWIVRDLADNLCICENLKFDVDSLVGMENFIPFNQYNHLFNFIENEKSYLIEDLLRGSEDDC